MTFDEIICGALAFLNLPVAELVYRGKAAEYCTYNLIAERELEHADDGAELVGAEYHIHIYGRGDPQPVKRRVWRHLRAREDFYIHDAQVLYDDAAQERYHVVFDVDILNTAADAFGAEEEEGA